MRHTRPLVIALAALALSGPVAAQETRDLLARGMAANAALDPREAANQFEAILVRDSLHPEANWRAAVALVDIGKRTPDHTRSPARDSQYAAAERYARRAVQVAPESAEAHFALALALGRAALTRSRRERIRAAAEVRIEALRAIELDPRHDGAWHVLGRWHAEIERLSNLEEFVARRFLGARVFEEASWEQAVRCLERAVALRPDFIYHRLDLAEVLLELGRVDEARPHLMAIADLPAQDVMDHVYRARAEVLRSARVKGR